MGQLGAANSLGMILGPAVSGALATFGLLAPLYFAAMLAACAAILVWRQLPLTPEDQLTPRSQLRRLRFTDPRLRLSVLLLNDGVNLDGERLLPEGYVTTMSTATAENPHAAMGTYVAGDYIENRGAANPDVPHGLHQTDGTSHINCVVFAWV